MLQVGATGMNQTNQPTKYEWDFSLIVVADNNLPTHWGAEEKYNIAL
jgi:hypothetical protein